MGRVNRYEFQGEAIQVPVAWDEALGRTAGWTAAPAAIIINFPVLCWAYVITRNGGRNGAHAGAARAPKPRRR